MTYFFPKTDVQTGNINTITYDGASEYVIVVARRFLSVHNKVGIRVFLYLHDGPNTETRTLGYINCTSTEYDAETSQEIVTNYVTKRNIATEDVYISDTAIVNGGGTDVNYIAVTVVAGSSPTPDSFTLKIVSDTTGYTSVTLVGVGLWPLVSVTSATLDPTVISQLDSIQEDVDSLTDGLAVISQEYTRR